MASPYFPNAVMITQDLITEILVRLPVKYLLRCKSVSKPWLSLICSPSFIDSQLRHAISKPGADRILMVYKSDNSTCSLNLDAPEIEVPLGFPFSRGDYSFQPDYKIIGAYNGIVCVSVTDRSPSGACLDLKDTMHYINNPSIYLWNPATKYSKLIPPHHIRDDISSMAIGFGFDPVDDDYKVLRVVFSMDGRTFSAEVYSANADVWQMLHPRPTDYPDHDDIDVCVNGFLCCKGMYGLMAFDLNTDVIACRIRLPARSFNYCITDYNDSLAIITFKLDELNRGFNLWTLDDEACLRGGGVEASWTLTLSINLDIVIDCIPPRVYGCFNNGDFLSRDGDGVCHLYNFHKKETRNVSGSIIIGWRIIKYNESLVSITGSKQIDENANEDDS